MAHKIAKKLLPPGSLMVCQCRSKKVNELPEFKQLEKGLWNEVAHVSNCKKCDGKYSAVIWVRPMDEDFFEYLLPTLEKLSSSEKIPEEQVMNCS